MNQRLAAAEAALKAGRSHEAIDALVAAIEDDPAQPAQVYKVLLRQLYGAGRFQDGEAWAAKAVACLARELEFCNLRGVFLRKVKRYQEAIEALDQAIRID